MCQAMRLCSGVKSAFRHLFVFKKTDKISAKSVCGILDIRMGKVI